MVSKIRLRIEQPLDARRDYLLENKALIVVGSQSDCHVCLPNTNGFVSRYHCLIETDLPHVFLTDLGSKNGIRINGTLHGGRIEQSRLEANARRSSAMPLTNGDRITLGDIILRLLVDDEMTEQLQRIKCEACSRVMNIADMKLFHAAKLCASCYENLATDPLVTMKSAPNVSEPVSWAVPYLNDYQCERILGRGGAGIVYLIRHTTTRKSYALKVLLDTAVVATLARATFLREIEILRSFSHPNIIEFIDWGTRADITYLITEYCAGGSLGELLDQQPRLSLTDALPIMKDVLSGLAFAHSNKIVHRDLKPDNILLSIGSNRRIAKIADMGLAKNSMLAGQSGLTETGSFAGTPGFMPREQVFFYKYVSPASDVWSLVATFYFMLTGKYPRSFPADMSPFQAVLLNDVVPIRQRDRSIPPRIADIIDQSLSDEVTERPKDAIELAAAFGDIF